ncbi:MAG: hypothetical protein L3K15_09465, partial [Thermoplasmata archaeon]|nr:hypothetical protein [Thermoplasmata archaeon]
GVAARQNVTFYSFPVHCCPRGVYPSFSLTNGEIFALVGGIAIVMAAIGVTLMRRRRGFRELLPPPATSGPTRERPPSCRSRRATLSRKLPGAFPPTIEPRPCDGEPDRQPPGAASPRLESFPRRGFTRRRARTFVEPVERELLQGMGNCFEACRDDFVGTIGMVAGARRRSREDVIATLRRMREVYGGDPEYVELRGRFPAEFPV